MAGITPGTQNYCMSYRPVTGGLWTLDHGCRLAWSLSLYVALSQRSSVKNFEHRGWHCPDQEGASSKLSQWWGSGVRRGS